MSKINQNFRIEHIRIESMEEFDSQIRNGRYDMFRGEKNASWTLNSSMVRKLLSRNNHKSSVLDFTSLKKEVAKHKEIYDKRISDKHKYIRFIFYLQHSISFSPFIDITRDLWIALSFAVESFQDVHDFNCENDAALYAFKIVQKNSLFSGFKNQGSVDKVLEKLSIGLNKVNNNKKMVEAYIVDPTNLGIVNDRMLLQKGAFLLLNNYSILSNNISEQIFDSPSIMIKKFILNKEILPFIFEDLKKIIQNTWFKKLKIHTVYLKK